MKLLPSYRNILLGVLVLTSIGIAVGYNIRPRETESKICIALHDHNGDAIADEVHLGFDRNKDDKYDFVRTFRTILPAGGVETPYNGECVPENKPVLSMKV